MMIGSDERKLRCCEGWRSARSTLTFAFQAVRPSPLVAHGFSRGHQTTVGLRSVGRAGSSLRGGGLVMQQAIEVLALPVARALEVLEGRFLGEELGRVELASPAHHRD